MKPVFLHGRGQLKDVRWASAAKRNKLSAAHTQVQQTQVQQTVADLRIESPHIVCEI